MRGWFLATPLLKVRVKPLSNIFESTMVMPGSARVYESGPFGFSLCRSLWAAGMACTVVNPADIPSADKDRRSKTDQVDARKLSMHLAAGLLHPIHVPTEKLQKQRSLIRFRKKLWGDLVRSKNRLKSELAFQGIVIPKQFDNPY
jgi:transposase